MNPQNPRPGRFVESFGRLHLAESLHAAGYSCAEPLIDNGVDLVAFKDGRYRTLQLKAATGERFRRGTQVRRFCGYPRLRLPRPVG